MHASSLCRWKLGLWLQASNGSVLSFIGVALSHLALLQISGLSLLQSLQAGVPNVCTVDGGLPCQRMEHLVWFLTGLAVTVPGLQFISVAAMNLATDVLFFPVS